MNDRLWRQARERALHCVRTAAASARRAAVPLALAALAGCAATTTTSTVKVKVDVLDSLRRYEHAYLLQPGDQLEVFVYRQPEFSRKAIVRPDGAISLPLVQEVRAAGKTPKQLADELTASFAARLIKPEVTVIVENPPEPSVYVVGQVGAPRAVPLRQARTVAQALALAGDAARPASPENISVIRLNADGFLEARRLDLGDGPASQPEVYMALNNMTLQPNDVVLVPEGARSQAVRTLQDVNTALAPLFNVLILRSVTK